MNSKQVLIIDDEAEVRTIVQSCLEDLGGWRVITAKSGQEGLLMAKAVKPDAIVLDVMMPGMDGLTFLQKLRRLPSVGDTPVILLTAKASLTNPHLFDELEVAGAIAKPFDPLLISNQIATFLGWTIST